MTYHDRFSPFELSFFDRADLLTVFQSFYDASEGGGFLSVGGYIFRKRHIKPFEKRWKKMLKKYDLDYFDMTDCNAGQQGFKNLTDTQCDDCAREAISIITDYAQVGITSTVSLEDYNKSGLSRMMNSPFSIASLMALRMAASWGSQNDHDPRMFYVFESGDEYQSDANELFNSISCDAERRIEYSYEDHAFLTKRGSLPTQAADILAWSCRKQFDRQVRGIDNLRGDFKELVDKVETRKVLWDIEKLSEIKSNMDKYTGSSNWQEVVFLTMRRNKSNYSQIDKKIEQIVLQPF